MKHLMEFGKYSVNEYSRETYDNLIKNLAHRDDPRGKRLIKTALSLRMKHHGSKGLIFKSKDSDEPILLDLEAPIMQGSEQILFKVNNEAFVKIDDIEYAISSLNVRLSYPGMCGLWFYGTGGLGVKHCFADRKSANWIANEITSFLQSKPEYKDWDPLKANQIPQI